MPKMTRIIIAAVIIIAVGAVVMQLNVSRYQRMTLDQCLSTQQLEQMGVKRYQCLAEQLD